MTIKDSSNRRYEAATEHLCCDLNGTSVILSLQTEKYYGINSVGSFIWSAVQEPRTFQQIQSAVLAEFEVDENVCRQEVLAFLEKMVDQQLIKVVDEEVK